jgi:hypothetical protein
VRSRSSCRQGRREEVSCPTRFDCGGLRARAGPSAFVRLERYVEYCDAEPIEALGKKEFGQVMMKLGYQDHRESHERVWRGLTLSTEGHDNLTNLFAARMRG